MRIIGLTGGIGSGKSTVAGFLMKLGGTVVDADHLAREVVMPGTPAYVAIVGEFGTGILSADRTIDRKALGSIVFADPVARRRLEAITHPAIRKKAEERLALIRQEGTPVVFYMAPLLIEAGATARVDEIWVVYADRETQVRRVTARDGINRDEALQRLAAQMPMEEKKKFGTVIIDNRGTLAETERQVREAWQDLVRRSGCDVRG